ncbi:MAG: MMPL family transporter [Oscillospiraceae bacterium]
MVPFIFLAAIVAGFFVSGRCPYAYGYSTLTTPKLNETQIAENLIGDTFTSTNMIALTVPAGDYEKEAALLTELESMEEIDYSMGLANVEAMNGYMLADKLMPRQFSELADLDYEMAQVLYAAYATEQGDYGKLMGNISSYKVPLIDMFLFVCEQADAGVVQLSSDQTAMLQDAKTQMESAKAQLQGKDYSRMLLYLTLPESGDETYAFLDTVRETAQRYYPDGNVYVAGNSSTEYDFEKSFARDNTVVSIVSLLIVLVVLLFTFKSAGMPLLLIVVIQGSIWINFSIPTLTGTGVFFMSYLVVSSIQMGANIDYAIVIASRYQEIKGAMSHREAMTESLNFAFPTVMTSGTIMTVAGILIGGMTSEAAIVGIGQSIGRGTIISMILVLFVPPQILLLGGGIADKTSFSMPSAIKQKEASGRVFVDGFVTGQISGAVSGMIRANVDGDVNLNVISGNVAECPPECQQEEGGNETK